MMRIRNTHSALRAYRQEMRNREIARSTRRYVSACCNLRLVREIDLSKGRNGERNIRRNL